MSSNSEGYLQEMPSVSSTMVSIATAPQTSPEPVVVINGIRTAITEGGKTCIVSSAQSAPICSVSSSPVIVCNSTSADASSHSSLFTIVPSRVVVSAPADSASLVTTTSSIPKSAIVAPSDSPQIIVVSESDGSVDSNSNGTIAAAPATVNINVGEAYVQAYYTVSDGTMYAAAPPFYSAGSSATYSSDANASPTGHVVAAAPPNTFIIQDVDAEVLPSHIHTSNRHSPATDGSVYIIGSGGGGSNGGSRGTASVVPTVNGISSSPTHGTTTSNDSGSSSTNLDADAQANIAHATRVSPATVQWLLDNYETAEGVSLPRSTLYNHYIHHCNDHNLDPVNSASFGKLIRSVFMGLRTRRLGTRGNSKYHYYGIRVRPNSILNNLSEDGSRILTKHHDSSMADQKISTTAEQQQLQPSEQQLTSQVKSTSAASSNLKNGDINLQNQNISETSQQSIHNQQYLGDLRRTLHLRSKLIFNSSNLPSGLSIQYLESFCSLYQEHCETILDSILNLQFHLVDSLWRKFWANSNNNIIDINPSGDISEDDEGELYSKLPSSIIQAICQYPPVLDFIKDVDYQLYQNLVEVLIPDVLRAIPPNLTQSIRNFAKSLEGWLSSALIGYPQEFMNVKIGAVSSLAQTLRRYTSLNHLAQAARAVLQNSSQITQMLADLNRVDFHNIQEQASWVCQCDFELVESLEEEFKKALQQQNNLEQWADWLHCVVDKILSPFTSFPDFLKHARQFLLKWSFYSSMVIRDLTLRSAASFGSFHLIRLLYDEYMFFLVEHKVADSLDLSPLAVMSQCLEASKSNCEESHYSKVPQIINGEDSKLSTTSKRPKFEES